MSELVHITVGRSLAASLEPLVHQPNAASLRFFCRFSFGRYSSELAELVSLTHTRHSDCSALHGVNPNFFKKMLKND